MTVKSRGSYHIEVKIDHFYKPTFDANGRIKTYKTLTAARKAAIREYETNPRFIDVIAIMGGGRFLRMEGNKPVYEGRTAGIVTEEHYGYVWEDYSKPVTQRSYILNKDGTTKKKTVKKK